MTPAQRLARIELAKLAVLEGMDRAEAARTFGVPYIVLAPHNFNLDAYRAQAVRNTHSSDER